MNLTAIVFLIAGQSNAGGCAPLSAWDPVVFERTYIYNYQDFEPLTPGKNLLPCLDVKNNHGIELALAEHLEAKYPNTDIYFIKHGPGGTSMYDLWHYPDGREYKKFVTFCREGISKLRERYNLVEVRGLYWDQGESDRFRSMDYGPALSRTLSGFRMDIGEPCLTIYVRKHLFYHGDEVFKPILNAQRITALMNPFTVLLDIDKGTNTENYMEWSINPDREDKHINGRAYKALVSRMD